MVCASGIQLVLLARHDTKPVVETRSPPLLTSQRTHIFFTLFQSQRGNYKWHLLFFLLFFFLLLLSLLLVICFCRYCSPSLNNNNNNQA